MAQVPSNFALKTPSLESQQRVSEGVQIFTGVVWRQRGPDGALQPESAQDGLCAMVSRANRYAFLIQSMADVFGAEAVDDEREHACFFRGRPDEPKAWDAQQAI